MELYQTYYLTAKSHSMGYNEIMENATKCVQSFEGRNKAVVFTKNDERNRLERWITDGYVLLIKYQGDNQFMYGIRRDGIKQ